MNRKFVYAVNILATIPAALVLPLSPFIFILIQGEGRIPGFFHEYLLRFLMIAYPVALAICLFMSIRMLRANRVVDAFCYGLVPLMLFLILLFTFLFGGVVLR